MGGSPLEDLETQRRPLLSVQLRSQVKGSRCAHTWLSGDIITGEWPFVGVSSVVLTRDNVVGHPASCPGKCLVLCQTE